MNKPLVHPGDELPDHQSSDKLPAVVNNPSGLTVLHPAADISKVVRTGLISILLVFGFLGGWAALAPLSGAVIASGYVKIDTNRKTVQHLEGGIIREIRVRDGDNVRAGDVLIVIEDEVVTAGVDQLQGQLSALRIKSARLEAERTYAERISFPQEVLELRDDEEVSRLIDMESAFFETRRRSYLEQESLLRQQAEEAKNELEGLSSQVSSTRSAIELLDQEITAKNELEKMKYIQMTEMLTLRRSLEEYRTRLGEYVSEVSRTRQKIIDLNLRIAGLTNEYISSAAQQLTEVNASIYSLQDRLRPSLDAKRRQQIVAPISGTIVDMRVFTVGGIVSPRQQLMDIVQDDGQLIVETQVPVDSIDNISTGQEADVRLSAYSARNTPLILGTVTYISADRLEDERTGAAFYLAHIDLDRDSLQDAGDQIQLYPGMPAEVYIKTGERTALDYLLAPVTQTLRNSARQP